MATISLSLAYSICPSPSPLSLKTFLMATISLSLAYSICPSPSPSLYMMTRMGSFPLASRYRRRAFITAGPISLITSSSLFLKIQVLLYLEKAGFREDTRAPTSVPFLLESLLALYPMIMVSLRGKSMFQGSPPSLQHICMATLLATEPKPLSLEITVQVITWLGVGFSTQQSFLTAW